MRIWFRGQRAHERYIELSYTVALEEGGHILVAHELTTSSLRLSFSNRRARLVIDVNGFGISSRNRQQHFGCLILIGGREFPNFLNGFVKQLGHA